MVALRWVTAPAPAADEALSTVGSTLTPPSTPTTARGEALLPAPPAVRVAWTGTVGTGQAHGPPLEGAGALADTPRATAGTRAAEGATETVLRALPPAQAPTTTTGWPPAEGIPETQRAAAGAGSACGAYSTGAPDRRQVAAEADSGEDFGSDGRCWEEGEEEESEGEEADSEVDEDDATPGVAVDGTTGMPGQAGTSPGRRADAAGTPREAQGAEPDGAGAQCAGASGGPTPEWSGEELAGRVMRQLGGGRLQTGWSAGASSTACLRLPG